MRILRELPLALRFYAWLRSLLQLTLVGTLLGGALDASHSNPFT